MCLWVSHAFEVKGNNGSVESRLFESTTESPNSSACTSLDFDSNGEFLVVGSEAGDSIEVFGCGEGERKRTIFSKKYGVGQIKFAHHSSTVIYSSTKGDDGN
jgi:hypothetical protein